MLQTGCWLLGKVVVYADPAMLEVTNLDHASPATILFLPGSVITFDIVPALGAEDVLAALSAGLRPQGGVQAAPLPRGAHGHLHHPLHRHVPGSREKYFVIPKNL